MALGGAWVRTILGPNIVVFEGRTASADNDAMVLGLDGDAGADAGFTMPAGWPNGVGQSDLVAGVIADAVRHARTRVTVSSIVATGVAPCGFSVEPLNAPWEKVIRLNGTPTAAATLRVEVEYIHSLVR